MLNIILIRFEMSRKIFRNIFKGKKLAFLGKCVIQVETTRMRGILA